MGIKHKLSKQSNEKGYATEWNDEHKIDSDIDFAGHSGFNVGEPINLSDIATKNYVDAGGGGLGYQTVSGTTDTSTTSTSYIDMTNMSITVRAAGTYFIIASATIYATHTGGMGTGAAMNITKNSTILKEGTSFCYSGESSDHISLTENICLTDVQILNINDNIKIQWKRLLGGLHDYNEAAITFAPRTLTIIKLG